MSLHDENLYEDQRKHMVAKQIATRRVQDERVIKAMQEVPRHLFVPKPFRASAYQDSALPIGYGQTISQPHMVCVY